MIGHQAEDQKSTAAPLRAEPAQIIANTMKLTLFALLLATGCYDPDSSVTFTDNVESQPCIEIEDYERCESEGGVCVDAGTETLLCVQLERRCEFGPFEGCEGAPLRTP